MSRYRIDAVRYSAPAAGGLAFAEGGRVAGGRVWRWRWLASRERRKLQEIYDETQRPEDFPLRFEVVKLPERS